MNRKEIMITAVLVNSGLLIALFITALSFEKVKKNPTSPDLVDAVVEEAAPYYSKEVNNELKEIETPFISLESEESGITHKLPDLASKPVKEQVKEEKLTEVIVKKGDNLEKIAKANQTTIGEIQRLNPVDLSILKIGQVILVPFKEKSLKSSDSSDVYIVKVGDNPWTIAMKHHLKVSELLKLNQLNEEKAKKLRPGDKLKIR